MLLVLLAALAFAFTFIKRALSSQSYLSSRRAIPSSIVSYDVDAVLLLDPPTCSSATLPIIDRSSLIDYLSVAGVATTPGEKEEYAATPEPTNTMSAACKCKNFCMVFMFMIEQLNLKLN